MANIFMQVEVPYIGDGKSEYWQVGRVDDKTCIIIRSCETGMHQHYVMNNEWRKELTRLMKKRGIIDNNIYASIQNAITPV